MDKFKFSCVFFTHSHAKQLIKDFIFYLSLTFHHFHHNQTQPKGQSWNIFQEPFSVDTLLLNNSYILRKLCWGKFNYDNSIGFWESFGLFFTQCNLFVNEKFWKINLNFDIFPPFTCIHLTSAS